MTKKTKIRIRKTVGFIRTLFLLLALLCIGITICSVDGPSIAFPIIWFIAGMGFFAASYWLDKLLCKTAWQGDKPSPFHH
jgi:hypothetical protein